MILQEKNMKDNLHDQQIFFGSFLLTNITTRIWEAFDVGIKQDIHGLDLIRFVDQSVRPYLLENHSTPEGLDSLWKEIKMPIFANMSKGQDAKTAVRNLSLQLLPEQEQRILGYIFSK